MVASAPDELRPLYRVMQALGAAAILILALGLAFFLRFAPPGQHTGLKAKVEGVYAYEPQTHQTLGGASTRFAPGRPFAAKVDWSGLPASVSVGAHWYNTLDQELGGVGPSPAGSLAAEGALVPVALQQGPRASLPGRYTMVVARYRGRQPVELLARVSVTVERPG